jgi:hypothetical protein
VKRSLQVGGAVLATYVAVALATLAWSGHVVRPLFEGVGPPPAYNWVKPPSQFAANNVAPKPKLSDIPLNGSSTGPAVAATDDGQFVVNFAQGSLPPHGTDTSVHAVITPLDPAKLAPAAAGLVADGNAYRIDLTYMPSGVPVSALAVPGDVIMTAPHNAATLLYSADGSAWQKITSQQVGGPTTIGSSFSHAGVYLVAANPQSTSASGSSKGGVGTVLIAVWVAIGAAVLGSIAWVVAGRRREARKRRGRQGRRRR